MKIGRYRIVDCKTPIISFLRFSESEMISRSKMLNDVIGDSEHDFFYRCDCEGGSAKCILVDGLTELCWYLPAGKESDNFSDIVTFTIYMVMLENMINKQHFSAKFHS